MSRCLKILCACLIAATLSTGLCANLPATTLSTVSQINALSEEDYARALPISLTGLVVKATTRDALLHDVLFRNILLYATDGACSFRSTNVFPEVGHVIQASGFTELNPFANDPFLWMTNALVLGKGDIPPPELLTADEIFQGKGNRRIIRVRGFLMDAFEDDIDSLYVWAFLNSGGRLLTINTRREPDTLNTLLSLVNTDIELTCTCTPLLGGKRRYTGPCLSFDSPHASIRILTRPPDDPFDAPPLAQPHRMRAENVAAMKRHSVHGRVLAAWQGKFVLLSYGKGAVTRLELARGEHLPRSGDWIDAIGFPETDLFDVNLSNVRLRPAKSEPIPEERPQLTSPHQILRHPLTNRFDHDYHGRLIRLRGMVRSVPAANHPEINITLESDGVIVAVDASSAPEILSDLQIGYEVEMTGVCNAETSSWQPQRILPTIKGFTLILRMPNDVRILSRPPWWTPQRLLVVLAGLVFALATILVWNVVLRKLIERRSRELTRAQAAQVESELRIDERTRIAAELHDYLAQNLTAVAYKLTSARAARTDDPEAADAQLETAATMLDSSRTELRRCLWDLKSKALEEPTFDLAIRRSLQQITDLRNVDLNFNVPRTRVSDPTAHAILSVIRELVANSVCHGLADRIAICGKIAGGSLDISVEDNGCGFDVSAVNDSDSGHFGLDGIRQRVKRLDGTFEIASQPNGGTQAVIRIPLHVKHSP